MRLDSVIQQLEEDFQKKICMSKKERRKSKKQPQQRKSDDEKFDDDRMSKLPLDIVMEIFCKVPIKSIIYCKCVSKAWRGLILDPCFARLHLTRAPTVLMFQYGSVKINGQRNIYMVEPETSSYDAIMIVNMGFNIPKLDTNIVGSCNGLLCLCDDQFSQTRLYISNPVTGERMTLPKIKMDLRNPSDFGFGFSSKTNQYKVLRMTHGYRGRIEAEIWLCTIGINSTWRNIGYPPYRFPHRFYSNHPHRFYSIFLNGALHWIVSDNYNNHSTVICAFDIGNEQFLTIPLPPISLSGQGHGICWANLGVIEGCLYICAFEKYLSPSYFEIWVMKDYGVKECWTKEHVIKDPWVPPYAGAHFQVVRYSRKEETSMIFGQGNVAYYDAQTGSLRCLNRGRSETRIEVFHHIPSFLSLEDMIGESSLSS